ncbi:hypothetical protein sS8_1479 [Methylocaldum marinum]|uniref:MalT-like TPR region domain-containing protein n=2 Tax=Methylocaldum marinum TaxID=1432792 RepID=A0A250KUI5_9GAMM|nr:hypothetical protein sS8_1479 [Methylocaldum marinum]
MLYESLGEYWLTMGKPVQARTEAQRLIEVAVQPGDRHFLALGHRLLARIAMAEGDWYEAESQVSLALAIIEGIFIPMAAWRIYAAAADLKEGQGCIRPRPKSTGTAARRFCVRWPTRWKKPTCCAGRYWPVCRCRKRPINPAYNYRPG